MKRLKPPYNKV